MARRPPHLAEKIVGPRDLLAAQKQIQDQINGLDVSPLTTKGDLTVRSAGENVRLGAGSDGQVLTADSSKSEGVKWQSPAMAGFTDPGSMSLVTGQFMFQYKRLALSGKERFVAAGTTRLVVSSFNLEAPNYVGVPRSTSSPFNVAPGYGLDIYGRMTLLATSRATLEGTARVSVRGEPAGRLTI